MNAPTDLELMMFHDGELEEPRQSEVRSFVEAAGAKAAVSQKLTGLTMVGDLVRDHALSVRTPAITATVMSKIIGERAAKTEDPRPSLRAADRQQAGAGTGAAKTTAANDNGKLIFGLAGLAAAAAAALFLWGRTPAQDAPVAANTAAVEATENPAAIAPEPAATVAERAPASAASTGDPAPAVANADDDAPRSVEVASVDFGSRSGAIYYVSGDNKPTSTTVVWVRDE